MAARVRNLGGGVTEISIGDNMGADNGSEWEAVGPRTHFKSKAEMVKAMASLDYKKSEGYRRVVRQIISQSDPVVLGLAAASGSDRFEYQQQKTAAARELFKDPRYKTDARYRQYVADVVSSQEADGFYPELSQAAVDRQQARVRGGSFEEPTKMTGPVNPNAKRDRNGDLR
ncbi:hypothetical protein FBQ96_00825 [Nitrospirales bacterium NOB]|nr:hypothetical protein [Nitrospirales bacterium NOB]